MKRVCNCYQTVSTTALLICKLFPLINCKRSEGCCRLEWKKTVAHYGSKFFIFFFLFIFHHLLCSDWLTTSQCRMSLKCDYDLLRCLHFLNCHKNLSNKNKSWMFFVRKVKISWLFMGWRMYVTHTQNCDGKEIKRRILIAVIGRAINNAIRCDVIAIKIT